MMNFLVLNPTLRFRWITENWEEQWIDMAKDWIISEV